MKGSLRKIALTILLGRVNPSSSTNTVDKSEKFVEISGRNLPVGFRGGKVGGGAERANRGRKRVLMGETPVKLVHRSVKRGDHRHVVINTHCWPEIYRRLRSVRSAARGLPLLLRVPSLIGRLQSAFPSLSRRITRKPGNCWKNEFMPDSSHASLGFPVSQFASSSCNGAVLADSSELGVYRGTFSF